MGMLLIEPPYAPLLQRHTLLREVAIPEYRCKSDGVHTRALAQQDDVSSLVGSSRSTCIFKSLREEQEWVGAYTSSDFRAHVSFVVQPRFSSLERTRNARERIISVGTDKAYRADYKHQDHCQHDCIFGNILPLVLRPKSFQ